MAKTWLELLTKEINLYFQVIDKDEAKRNIAYLEKKIAETSIAEMQSVFLVWWRLKQRLLCLRRGLIIIYLKLLFSQWFLRKRHLLRDWLLPFWVLFQDFYFGVALRLLDFIDRQSRTV